MHDPYILVALRGTCFRAKYRRQDAPWLATDEYGPEDPEATITSNEFRTLTWAAANEEARQLGWIRSFDELHKAVAASAIGVGANARFQLRNLNGLGVFEPISSVKHNHKPLFSIS